MAQRVAALKKGRTADEILALISSEFGPPATLARLRDAPAPFVVIGENIDPSAISQLELALRLPAARRGALMPDAHPGFSLPIGGVVALENAVSPAFVGVDIGCRMHLSVFDVPPADFLRSRDALFADLLSVTTFGAGGERSFPADHAVLDAGHWTLTAQTKSLRGKAVKQLGTSGSGNHFAELVVSDDFCGLLTHSGSRGVGFAIAGHYSKLAAQETARRASVPKMYEWLDLDGDAGREYWEAMTLAGDFAQACHEVMHEEFGRRTGLTAREAVQNHHNFAWREEKLIVHRKGATPAHVGERGIIPGSMATASYLVEGLGNDAALNSASHGAGRLGSRADARAKINLRDVKRQLAEADIFVDGLSADESPGAYKDIERVMQLQIEAGLIKPLARMRPVAVIMAGES